MSILGDIFGAGGVAEAAGTISSSIKDVLVKVIPDADKRLEVESQLNAAIQARDAAQFNAMQAVMAADAQSDSKYTKNARPTVVYWSLGMVTTIAVLALFDHAKPVIDALAVVPQGLWDLIKYGVGIFTAGRTIEKTAAPLAAAIVNAVAKRK